MEIMEKERGRGKLTLKGTEKASDPVEEQIEEDDAAGVD